MNRELLKDKEDKDITLKKTPLDRKKSRKIYLIDIALIRGTSFYLGIRRKENKFFITSLYKINYIINKKINP